MEWKHISDKEVWSIPAGSTIAAIEDPECRIYECPIDYAEVEASYISFRGKAGGKADTVYKIKDICNGVNVSDPNELNALYAEKPEYQHEHEKIVYAQRVFNQIRGKKLHRLGMTVTVKKVNTRTEQKRQRDPEGRPKQGFLHFDDMNLAIENAEVESEHRENENTEKYPPQGHCFNPFIFKS